MSRGLRWRRVVLSRLFGIFAVLLGVTQVLVGHWVTVVLAGREGPGWLLGSVLALGVIAANLGVLPVLRGLRRRPGWPRRIARAWFAMVFATFLLGIAIGLAWLGYLPLAGLLALAGVSGDLAFEIFRVLSIAVAGGLVAMLLWGFTGGLARVDRTHLRIPMPGLHASLGGLRIVQLSDLHIGNGLEGGRLEALVDEVNRLEADLVALTGDLFDFDKEHVVPGAERLGGLRARHGVYAVLGNHDVNMDRELVVTSLARHAPNVRLLGGEVHRVPVEHPFYVAGIEDPGRNWTGRDLELPELDALAAARPGDGPVLLLVHRPEAFPQASRLGFPLMLAGHTHGGQIALPIPGGHLNPARLITRFHRGLYRLNGSTLYVNRGFGVAGPAIRFNCPREIATIELVVAG